MREKMNVEFYYFDGCPSYQSSLENLREVLREENINADLKLINVESPEKAEMVGFQGSPSIKINGKDLEGKNEGFSYSCRIYGIQGKNTGILSKEYIWKKILTHI
jgi:hypothetical protein